MHWSEATELLLFVTLLIIATPILGKYMAWVFTHEDSSSPSTPLPTSLHTSPPASPPASPSIFPRALPRIFKALEHLCYRIGGIHNQNETHWTTYAKDLFCFNALGLIALFLLQSFQYFLPLNPQNFPGVPWHTAFNTAVSFVTNTNWQSYPGETTLSYFTQMIGLTVQNFLSAATGMAAMLVLIRGLIRKSTETVGNFWQDLVRSLIYILLPLSFLFALVLISEGVVQTFSPYVEVVTLENATQTIPLGPVASQVAIKQLGTNGGGFFNANSAHPFENPTGLTNFLEMFAILLIPAALTYTFVVMVHSKSQGWLLFGVMLAFWIGGLAISILSEHLFNPVLDAFPVMEGKETRFGTTNSLIWAVSTTATSSGSVNAMLSSLSPLAGGVALLNIMIGESIFGGVGVGLASMITFVIFTVFLSGLMVGRTPEYLGKKIEKREIRWVLIAILTPSALILAGAGISSVLPAALSSLSNQGPHGLTELLYAFSSAAGNNGSAFAGLNANTPYYNLILGMIMLFARIAILLPSLAIGGLLAAKKTTPPSKGTFSTNTLLFAVILFGVIFIMTALTFFPALSLGAIVEHFLMLEGRAY